MEATPEITEFDHLKDHFEPYLRRGLASSAKGHGSLFGLSGRARGAVEARGQKDELEKYEPIVGSRKGKEREDEALRVMREMTNIEDVAPLDKRWASSWNPPLKAACVVSFALCIHEIEGAAQGAETTTNAPPSETLETLSRMQAHPYQARTEVFLDTVQDQARRIKLLTGNRALPSPTDDNRFETERHRCRHRQRDATSSTYRLRTICDRCDGRRGTLETGKDLHFRAQLYESALRAYTR
jgi:hypothetical protein